MSEWQPIETAPHEEEILGCWCKSGVMGVVTCIAGQWEENDEPVSSPSHWMQLPEPPAANHLTGTANQVHMGTIK